jgi:uracil-DNA glycosylase family 4
MERDVNLQAYWLWLSDRGQIWPLQSEGQPCSIISADLHNISQNEALPLEGIGNQEAAFSLQGFGYKRPKLLIIGDAPMNKEESDMILNMIKAMGLSTSDSVFVADFFEGLSGYPSSENFAFASEQLNKYVNSCPTIECILSLGVLGAKILYGESANISDVKSKWLDCPANGSIPAMATYHPRDMIKRPESKKPAWADLQNIIAKLNP